MKNLNEISEKLSVFNNAILTKKQWDIVLTSCGCPKSQRLWRALREHTLKKVSDKLYVLSNFNSQVYEKAYNEYCISNRESVRKAKSKQTNPWNLKYEYVY